jgi:hypothetical protein
MCMFALARNRRWILLSALFIVVASWARTAAACACDENPPCAAVWHADAVFIGKAVYAYSEPIGPSTSWWVNTISVSQPLRGAIDPVVTLVPWVELSAVRTRGAGGAMSEVMSTCDYRFELGRDYMIYAFKTADGRWRTSICAGTKPLDEAMTDLDYIANLPFTSVGGHIHVRIEHLAAPDSNDTDRPAVGIPVVLRSDAHFFQVATDSQGIFEAEVPPGDYLVAPVVPSTFRLHNPPVRVSPPRQGCAPIYFSFSIAPP